MPFSWNPYSGTLDFLGVSGPPTSTDIAIARWDGTSGQILQDSKALLQDGGGIEAQAFMTDRVVDDIVSIHSNFSMLAANIELELTGSLEIELDAEVIII